MELQGLVRSKRCLFTEEIETSQPVHVMLAELDTQKTEAEILKAFDSLSELDKVEVLPAGSIEIKSSTVSAPKEASVPAASPPPQTAIQSKPAAADAPPASAPKPSATPVSVEKTVRTSVERLDNLMNLVGE
jgi:chemotaxis protein histidine kinase CheA